jgi:hypothetical protein
MVAQPVIYRASGGAFGDACPSDPHCSRAGTVGDAIAQGLRLVYPACRPVASCVVQTDSAEDAALGAPARINGTGIP